jgi:hypothetical protein
MAGLVPAIHVLFPLQCYKDVDARHKAGHDQQTVVADFSVQFSRAPIPVSTRKSGLD